MDSINALLEHPNPFGIDINEMRELRFKAIKGSFEHHYSNNEFYRKLCEKYEVTPNDIVKNEDLLYIPLVASDFFKELSRAKDPNDIVKSASVSKEEIVTYFTTSGTTGKPSKYPFNRKSLGMINRSNAVIFRYLPGIGEDDYVLMLTPSPEESKTGLVQGMYLCLKELLKSDEKIGFAVKGGVMDPGLMIDMINSVEDKIRHLYGPPFVYNALADYMLQKGEKVELEEESKVITTGGWKKVEGEVKRGQMYEKMEKTLGVDRKNIRDGLGLTDIMTIINECEYHQKHAPPWLHVSIRDTKDLTKETELGEPGLIAFMSPLIDSYPAFVITGDMGRKSFEEKCECELNGPTIEYLRRASGMESRGCAIVLADALKAMKNV